MKLKIKTVEELLAERDAQEREKARAEARAYLASTDWLVVRQAETGMPVPDEVAEKRAAARQKLRD